MMLVNLFVLVFPNVAYQSAMYPLSRTTLCRTRPQPCGERRACFACRSLPGVTSTVISTAESAAAGIAAPVPVGSAPEPSHKRTGPQLSCRACGTYLHGLNAPNSNSPNRHVPTAHRYASDRPLVHRTLQLPRHDLAVQPAKAEFVAIDRKAQ